MSASKLARPSVEYKDSFLKALEEFHHEGKFRYYDLAETRIDFEKFVNFLRFERDEPHQPLQEWAVPVPETVVWLVKEDEYLGTVEIRHRLNWHLERWGGHIHFSVRPSLRGKGFGRKILLKSIPVANYLGIDRALITVAPDNTSCIRVVESCGAVYEDTLPETDQFPSMRRYWLNCT